MPSIINRRGRPPHPDILTPAEWQVLEGVRAGLTNQEIADHLGVTFHTVKFHISNMLGKLHLEDRQALAVWRPNEPETPGRRHWARWLPFGGLKAAGGTAAGAAIVVGGAVATVIFLAAGDEDQAAGSPTSSPAQESVVPAPTRPDTLGPTPAAATDPADAALPQGTVGVEARILALSAAFSRVSLTVEMDAMLPERTVPNAADLTVTAITSEGRVVLTDRGRDYTVVPDKGVWIVRVETAPLPEDTVEIEIEVRRLALRPPGSPEPPADLIGPWIGTASIDDAPELAVDLSDRVPARIDTGFGWAYVIDGVDLSGSELAVTYHAEGNVRDLRPWLLTAYGDATRTVMFQALTPQTVTFQVAPGEEAVTVWFGPAERQDNLHAVPGTGTLESGDWSITIPLD